VDADLRLLFVHALISFALMLQPPTGLAYNATYKLRALNMATKRLYSILVRRLVRMTSGADADAMFTLTVWHMMGTPPTDPGVLPTVHRLL